MGLIPDQRPRDWAYKAVFKEKDLPSLEEMTRKIRETHDVGMIEDFNQKCEQKLTGETAVLNNGIEIQSVTKTGDLAVNIGLAQCINLIIGSSPTRWTHFGFGVGSDPVPAVTDTALLVETISQRVILAWNEPVGMRLYFGGISSQTSGTSPDAVGEIGVYAGATAGVALLNRSVFWRTGVIQQENPGLVAGSVRSSPIVVSSVIELCPVA